MIIKPSEKVPLTLRRLVLFCLYDGLELINTHHRVMKLLIEAGVPKGVVNLANGVANCVEALIDHPGVSGVTFVGSTKVCN